MGQRARASARSRAILCARPGGERFVFLHLSSFAIRWTVPVPIPSDFATFKIPMPFASCFRTLRSKARDENAAEAEPSRSSTSTRSSACARRARGMKASRGCTSERRD